MWIRFLKLCARRPLTACFVGVAMLSLALLVPIALSMRGEDRDTQANPRLLVNRLWIDRYPEKSRDEVDIILFFGSGFGVYEHGSRFKATMELFEYERRGDSVELTFWQDKKRQSTRFEVTTCTDDRHFDLCLDFADSPRGPRRYRSWGDDDEDAARLPWARSWKRAAEDRVRDSR